MKRPTKVLKLPNPKNPRSSSAIHKVRLHKFLANQGIASRRQCEKLIAQGHVQVNGHRVTTLGTSVDPQRDYVRLDNKLVRPQKQPKQYYVFHKPRNIVTTMRDPQGRPTVADYLANLKEPIRLFPVGRLDYDVSGCLLLTNDGELTNRLLHPRYQVARVYEVKVAGEPRLSDLAKLEKHVERCRVQKLRSKTEKSWYRFTLYEGKYHQVKRLWMDIGYPVIKMKRSSYAGITLADLSVGRMRPLTASEKQQLFAAVNLDAAPAPSLRSPRSTSHR